MSFCHLNGVKHYDCPSASWQSRWLLRRLSGDPGLDQLRLSLRIKCRQKFLWRGISCKLPKQKYKGRWSLIFKVQSFVVHVWVNAPSFYFYSLWGNFYAPNTYFMPPTENKIWHTHTKASWENHLRTSQLLGSEVNADPCEVIPISVPGVRTACLPIKKMLLPGGWASTYTQEVRVWFPIRAHAWDAGSIPSMEAANQ